MKLCEKYSALQVKAHYKKFINGKISTMEFLQCAKRCISKFEYLYYVKELFLRQDNYDKIDNEGYEFFVKNVLFDMFGYETRSCGRGGNPQYIRDTFRSDIRELLTYKNVSNELKCKFLIQVGMQNQNLFTDLINYNFAQNTMKPMDIIDSIVFNVGRESQDRYEISNNIELIIIICNKYLNEYNGKEIKKYAFDRINEMNFKKLSLDSIDNKINVYFNEFVDAEEELYRTVKSIMKNSLSDRIKEVVRADLPFGMIVNAFVETITQDIISLEPEMVEQLNASIIAYKILKKT